MTALTVDEFELLPEDESLYELVDGLLLEKREEPAGHEIVVSELVKLLFQALDDDRFFVMAKAVHNLSPATARRPDIAIWRWEDLEAVDLQKTLSKAPQFAIEVVSSESAADLQYKTVQYFRAGSQLVWLVYPRTRCVFAQWPDHHGIVFGIEDAIHAGDVIPGLKIPVALIFARIDKMEATHPTPR